MSGRINLLVYNSVAALTGVAAMFALVRSVMLDPSQVGGSEATRSAERQYQSQVKRLTFAPPGSLGQQEPQPVEEPTTQRSAQEPGSPGSWSTEIRTEPPTATPAPPLRQFTLLPSLRLPWQSAKPAPAPAKQTYTLKTRLAEIAPTANMRLVAKFEAAKAAWPPSEIALIAIKDEKALELHTRQSGGAWTLIHRYRVLAASGSTGPKLRQGDKQVPEGIYSIAFLNPNSAYHVSLAVNYPNAFDRQMAAKDGRKELGGDIMIHGKNLSAGCLAMGDEAVEELFVLAAQTGLPYVKLIIAPTDIRQHGLPAAEPGRPEWLPKLYAEIATAMADFKPAPAAKGMGLLSFFMNSH